jgi:hypothetical protein
MKQSFDELGVAYVQDAVFGLLAIDLVLECQFLRSDFTGWMTSKFNLHVNQHQQLLLIPASLKNALAHAIARSWEHGLAITFIKDTQSEHDVPDQKELVIIGLDNLVNQHHSSSIITITPLMIHIRYKYNH